MNTKRHKPDDFSALPEPVRKMVERLNAALEADRDLLSELFYQAVPGEAFESVFIVMIEKDIDGNEGLWLGPLGIVNGLLEAMGFDKYRIYREVEEGTDIINYFGVMEIQ